MTAWTRSSSCRRGGRSDPSEVLSAASSGVSTKPAQLTAWGGLRMELVLVLVLVLGLVLGLGLLFSC